MKRFDIAGGLLLGTLIIAGVWIGETFGGEGLLWFGVGVAFLVTLLFIVAVFGAGSMFALAVMRSTIQGIVDFQIADERAKVELLKASKEHAKAGRDALGIGKMIAQETISAYKQLPDSKQDGPDFERFWQQPHADVDVTIGTKQNEVYLLD